MVHLIFHFGVGFGSSTYDIIPNMQCIAAVLLWTGLATSTGATNQDLCSDPPPSCPPGEWPVCESDGSGHIVWKCVNVAGNPPPSGGKSNAVSGGFQDHAASSAYGAVTPNGVVPSSGIGGQAFMGFASNGYGARGGAPVVGFRTSSGGFGGASAGYGASSSSGYGGAQANFPISSSKFSSAPTGNAARGSGFGGGAAAHEASNSGFSGSMASYGSSSGYGGANAGHPLNSHEGFGAPSSGYGASPVGFGTYASSGSSAQNAPQQSSSLTSSNLHKGLGGNYGGQEASMSTGSSGIHGTAGRNNAQQMSAPAMFVPNSSSGFGVYGYGTYASSGNPSPGASGSAPPLGPNASVGYDPASLNRQGPAASSPYGYPSSGYSLPQQSAHAARGFHQLASGPVAGFRRLPAPSAGEGLKQIFKPFWPNRSASAPGSVPAPEKASGSGKEPSSSLSRTGFSGKLSAKPGKEDAKKPSASSIKYASPRKTGGKYQTASSPSVSAYKPMKTYRSMGKSKSQSFTRIKKEQKKRSNENN